MDDLDCLTLGFVSDVMTEAGNDDYDYKQVATQADFDAF